jgi:hypothetical protein
MHRVSDRIAQESPVPASTAPARRRSRAKPKPPRPRAELMSELRGLGGVVLEQALQDPAARPQPGLVAWAARLAAELGAPPPEPSGSYRDLMAAIVAINRDAQANPARPTEALPLAA